MKTTIDRAGRIVVPKALRDELSLAGGEPVELTVRDGRLEVEPRSASMRLERRGRGAISCADDRGGHERGRLTLPAREQRRLPRRFVELGLGGGSVYDALVALTAAHAGAPLVTCDRRAQDVYRRCGDRDADARLSHRAPLSATAPPPRRPGGPAAPATPAR